ncbi:MAG: helix-turn-helix domain-containing protein [Leadbetterella sp.]|nr:helix-turn-helix domain-containing protein [Leadbetterella sp.]
MIKHYKKSNDRTKAFRILIIYLTVTVMLFFILHRLGFDPELLQKIYSYMFLIQFALILNILLKPLPGTAGKKQSDPSGLKYKSSKLQDDDLKQIGANVADIIRKERLYRIESITLEDVAKYVNKPRHYVSQALNEGMNSSFYELINNYRLEECLLRMKQEPETPISEIYTECGFKSKTTFYKYFKEKTGYSPSEYRSNLLNR